jgi:branched-chain amino acid transport system ATP-binding protein
MGIVPVRFGSVRFLDRNIAEQPCEEVARLGVAYVPEERGIIPNLTVGENLRLGILGSGGLAEAAERYAEAFQYFPALKPMFTRRGGHLSGGEQQMLALARALMQGPRLLLLDEPSLGLAPLIIRELYQVVRRLNEEEGLAVLVVEQNATLALDVASRAYVLEAGRVALEGSSDELRRNDAVRRSYLGY